MYRRNIVGYWEFTNTLQGIRNSHDKNDWLRRRGWIRCQRCWRLRVCPTCTRRSFEHLVGTYINKSFEAKSFLTAYRDLIRLWFLQTVSVGLSTRRPCLQTYTSIKQSVIIYIIEKNKHPQSYSAPRVKFSFCWILEAARSLILGLHVPLLSQAPGNNTNKDIFINNIRYIIRQSMELASNADL